MDYFAKRITIIYRTPDKQSSSDYAVAETSSAVGSYD